MKSSEIYVLCSFGNEPIFYCQKSNKFICDLDEVTTYTSNDEIPHIEGFSIITLERAKMLIKNQILMDA